jgi:Calcineurin-like phosphoesterase/TAT (twin-arginine translocation) pathway signal sequence
MAVTRRQFLAGSAGVGAMAATAGLVRGVAWPMLAHEDLLPGSAPAISLAPHAWTTTPDRVRFAVVGDTGSGGRQALAVASRMASTYESRPFGAVVHVGDVSYYGSLAQRWDDVFDRPFRPLRDAGVRFDVAIGNHDSSIHRQDTAAEEVEAHLRLVGTPDEHYAVTHGPVDLFVLDSSVPATLGSLADNQLGWLDEALGRSSGQWRIVALHHPLYSSGRHGSTVPVRRVLEPILARHQVDLVLTGHDHDYERTHPQRGVTYVVSGGGAKIDGVGRSSFTASSQSTLQFLLVEVDGDRLTADCVRPDGAIVDRFELRARRS